MATQQPSTPSDPASPSPEKPQRILRWSYIHRRVQELGFPGLGEYLTQRYILEKKRIEDMAKECHVRENTIRKHLRFYGIELGTPREPKPTYRKGRTFVCRKCGIARYYSPAQSLNLDEATYNCRPCKNEELRNA